MSAPPPTACTLDPPLAGFLQVLRARGFVIGVEHHLRLHELLQRTPEPPLGLKYFLGPIFATSPAEQETFAQAFDDYFAHRTEVTQPPPRPSAIPWLTRERIALSACLAALMALVTLSHVMEVAQRTAETVSGILTSALRPTPEHPAEEASLPPLPELGPRLGAAPHFASNHRPTAIGDPGRWALWAGLAALPFAGLWLATRRSRQREQARQQALKNQPARRGAPPFTWPVRLRQGRIEIHDFRSNAFFRAVRKLRQRQPITGRRLHLARTIRATIARGGFPTFIYQADTRVPEYLVLIDRASPQDHAARFFDQLTAALRADGLFIERWFFRDDPRACESEDGSVRRRLSELQRAHPDHRLLIFSSGAGLIDKLTGRLPAWTEALEAWEERALLTPLPPTAWSRREETLAARLPVLAATLTGLDRAADLWQQELTGGLKAEGECAAPTSRDAWSEPRDLEELTDRVGPELLPWLAACAQHPELHWDLTLRLGALPAIGAGLVTVENLLRLVRLPWFRAGRIPPEWRTRLLALPQATATRQAAAHGEIAAVLKAVLDSEVPARRNSVREDWELEIAVHEAHVATRTPAELETLRQRVDDSRRRRALEPLTTQRDSPLRAASPGELLPRKLWAFLFRGSNPAAGLRPALRYAAATLIAAALIAATTLIPEPRTSTIAPLFASLPESHWQEVARRLRDLEPGERPGFESAGLGEYSDEKHEPIPPWTDVAMLATRRNDAVVARFAAFQIEKQLAQETSVSPAARALFTEISRTHDGAFALIDFGTALGIRVLTEVLEAARSRLSPGTAALETFATTAKEYRGDVDRLTETRETQLQWQARIAAYASPALPAEALQTGNRQLDVNLVEANATQRALSTDLARKLGQFRFRVGTPAPANLASKPSDIPEATEVRYHEQNSIAPIVAAQAARILRASGLPETRARPAGTARIPGAVAAVWLSRGAVANAEQQQALLREQADAAFYNANLLREQGKFDEALADLDRALRSLPDKYEYLVLRGQLLEVLLRFQEAVASFESAQKVATSDDENKAAALIRDLDLAQELATRAARSRADDPAILRQLAAHFTQAGRSADAARIQALLTTPFAQNQMPMTKAPVANQAAAAVPQSSPPQTRSSEGAWVVIAADVARRLPDGSFDPNVDRQVIDDALRRLPDLRNIARTEKLSGATPLELEKWIVTTSDYPASDPRHWQQFVVLTPGFDNTSNAQGRELAALARKIQMGYGTSRKGPTLEGRDAKGMSRWKVEQRTSLSATGSASPEVVPNAKQAPIPDAPTQMPNSARPARAD